MHHGKSCIMAEVKGSCHVSNEALVQLAIEARSHAYVPYLTMLLELRFVSDGTVVASNPGCNAAYTLNCAEQTHVFPRGGLRGAGILWPLVVVGGPGGRGPNSLVHSLVAYAGRLVASGVDPATFRIVSGKADMFLSICSRTSCLWDLVPRIWASPALQASCDDAEGCRRRPRARLWLQQPKWRRRDQ